MKCLIFSSRNAPTSFHLVVLTSSRGKMDFVCLARFQLTRYCKMRKSLYLCSVTYIKLCVIHQQTRITETREEKIGLCAVCRTHATYEPSKWPSILYCESSYNSVVITPDSVREVRSLNPV